MDDKNLPIPIQKSFEELKQINQYGAEYWSARDLQPMLGYNHWRSFDNAVTKAITSCEKSGNVPGHHFARAQYDSKYPFFPIVLNVPLLCRRRQDDNQRSSMWISVVNRPDLEVEFTPSEIVNGTSHGVNGTMRNGGQKTEDRGQRTEGRSEKVK